MMPGPLVGVLVGTFGKPPDVVAWAALAAAVTLGVLAIAPTAAHAAFGLESHDGDEHDHRKRVMLVGAFAAAFLSLGYIAYYLRGGPRIIDASSYFLEARALSHGKFAWSLPEPTASFRGRFLLFHEPDKLAVIFPPGYPLLLAAGFLVGAPMIIGPLLAAAIAVATYMLARELWDDPQDDAQGHAVATLALALSVACAALRYHTADTMSHGASALGITLALTFAVRGRRTDSVWHFAFAGLAAGYVLSTRPVSAVPILVTVGVLASLAPSRTRALGTALAALIPGVLLLMLSQRAATGSVLQSVQRAYYATSDGPPNCFHYGFGATVGCVYEHGDVVGPRLPGGYTGLIALETTLHRLKFHLIDVLNFEPLALLALVPAFKARPREPAPRREWAPTSIALLLVGAQVLVYVPFYFDGSYPGGGARFFADVLPIEHALIALAVATILPRISLLRKGLALVALSALGFATHAVFDHQALALRDGGRPFFEPDIVRDAQVNKGLVFFETDHGFNLAYDPGATVDKAVVAARQRGDDHDRMLYEQLGKPPTHIYRFLPQGSTVSVWVPGIASEDLWRFEAEAEWPPLSQSGGWVDPMWASGTCASSDRVLTLHTNDQAIATIELPVPRDGRWLVTPRLMRRGGAGRATLQLVPIREGPRQDEDSKIVWEWEDSDRGLPSPNNACVDLPPHEVSLAKSNPSIGGARLVLSAQGGDVTLDRTTMKWLRR
jgi:hypothetical protein